jgi:REP element-mobilizing transposase RayT
MAYHPNIHHRRSIRLKGYDYSRAGLYFITLYCKDRKHLFGKISNKSMVLNHFGQIVKEEWEKTAEIRKNVALHEYIIMPDHFHAILEILYSKKGELKSGDSGERSKSGELSDKTVTGELQFATGSDSGKSRFAQTEFKSPSQTIGAIIRGFKGASTKRINSIIREEEKKFSADSGGSKFGESLFVRKGSIWQRNYYEHIIRNEMAYQNIRNYIIKNPANWKKDALH